MQVRDQHIELDGIARFGTGSRRRDLDLELLLNADGQVQQAIPYIWDHVFVAAAANQGHSHINVRRVEGFYWQFVAVAAGDLNHICFDNARALDGHQRFHWLRERRRDEDAGGIACRVLLLIRDQQQVIVLRVPGHILGAGNPNGRRGGGDAFTIITGRSFHDVNACARWRKGENATSLVIGGYFAVRDGDHLFGPLQRSRVLLISPLVNLERDVLTRQWFAGPIHCDDLDIHWRARFADIRAGLQSHDELGGMDGHMSAA